MQKSSITLESNLPFPRNYASELLMLERGEGVHLWDAAGNRYLDFGSGIAVNALGHGRDDLARIAAEQMRKLVHVSNLYTTAPAVDLARKLLAGRPFGAVYFGNSGTEANEAAIKFARLHARSTRGEGNHRLLCFSGAFHGRTLGALSCTPSPAYQEPFGPLLPGVEVAPYNDPAQLERILDSSFAAVIVEPVQGEGGLIRMEPEFAAALNRLCRMHDVILIADEIQTGLGRTGRLFASEGVGLEPDIITLSKPLAGGLPLSATLIPERINRLLHPGDHGTTFGGGPVTTAVACRVWDIISDPAFLEAVARKGELFRRLLSEAAERHGLVREVRGIGLLAGLVVGETDETGRALAARVLDMARERGLLLLRSGKNVIRMAPPLIIEEQHLREGVAIVERVLEEIERDEPNRPNGIGKEKNA